MKLFSKILIICCLMLSFSYGAEVNFIQITDANVDSKNASKLLKTIKEINALKGIDFVVFGGNNLNKPNFDNLDIFCYLLKRVHKKTYVLLGSSDVFSSGGVNKEFYYKRISKSLLGYQPKSSNYVFKKKGYVFVAMDGSKQFFQSSNGYYSKDELKWLDNTLLKYKNKKVIILQHFPVLTNSSKWLETANIDEYNEILSKYDNVKVIVCGHYGYNLETEENGIYHILTESYSKNGAYKIIKIDLDDNFIGTYLIK